MSQMYKLLDFFWCKTEGTQISSITLLVSLWQKAKGIMSLGNFLHHIQIQVFEIQNNLK